MWLKTITLVVVTLIVGIVCAGIYGSLHWQSDTEKLRSRVEAGRAPVVPATYSPRELDGLPAPVQRYFRAVLKDGQPMVAVVKITHEGFFSASETGPKWVTFTSNQLVVTRRPGFDWDARMRMGPGVYVFVHDAYVAGEGLLHASLLGVATLADMRDTPAVAQGELMRFFAEAAWYPTALLPSQGVRWQAVNATSARATIRDGDVSATLLFRFNDAGLIDSVRAETRGRVVNGAVVPTPWVGRFAHYELHDDMRVPVEAEVAWDLPRGPLPYWRGRITAIGYEFAR